MMVPLGLEDVLGVGEGQPPDTSRFSFVDPSLFDRSFFEEAEIFPWEAGEPRDGNAENCIRYGLSSIACSN